MSAPTPKNTSAPEKLSRDFVYKLQLKLACGESLTFEEQVLVVENRADVFGHMSAQRRRIKDLERELRQRNEALAAFRPPPRNSDKILAWCICRLEEVSGQLEYLATGWRSWLLSEAIHGIHSAISALLELRRQRRPQPQRRTSH